MMIAVAIFCVSSDTTALSMVMGATVAKGPYQACLGLHLRLISSLKRYVLVRTVPSCVQRIAHYELQFIAHAPPQSHSLLMG